MTKKGNEQKKKVLFNMMLVVLKKNVFQKLFKEII